MMTETVSESLESACRTLHDRLVADGRAGIPLRDYAQLLAADTWRELLIGRRAGRPVTVTTRDDVLKAASGFFSVSPGSRKGDVSGVGTVILSGRNISFVVDFPFADTPATDDFGFVYPRGGKPSRGRFPSVEIPAEELAALMAEFDGAAPEIEERAETLRFEALRTMSLRSVTEASCSAILKDTLGATGIPYSIRMDGQDAVVSVSLGNGLQLTVRIPPENVTGMTSGLVGLVESTRQNMERFGHPYTIEPEQ